MGLDWQRAWTPDQVAPAKQRSGVKKHSMALRCIHELVAKGMDIWDLKLTCLIAWIIIGWPLNFM
jgi:hypothetical protein